MSSSTVKRSIAILAVSLLFLLVASRYFYQDVPWPMYLPLLLLLAVVALARFDDVLILVAFLTPFSIDCDILGDMQLSLPSEPLMVFFSVVFLFRALLVRGYYDRTLIRHGVGLMLLLALGWMLFTALTSQDVLVSIKYWLARLWFVVPFFYAAAHVFANPARIRQFVMAYGVALTVVVAITTFKTLGSVHDLQVLHRVMRPFYNDHTAYGCVLALFIPVVVYYTFEKTAPWWRRLLCMAMAATMAVGLAFSYCRAAWISLAAAVGLFVLIRLGMKLRWIMLLSAVGIGLFFIHQSDIMYQLSKNTQDSSLTLSDQLHSISNISTDASNLERLNRWACAFRMFEDHPIVGYGPGTYQFFYGSYQRSYQLSTISTNAGDLGNAHSEYIGPLAEQGIFGVLLTLAVFLTTFVCGVRTYQKAPSHWSGRLALALTLSLVTYYVHGLFNNFLDTDKLSVPFWAFTAAVVALNRYASDTMLRDEK